MRSTPSQLLYPVLSLRTCLSQPRREEDLGILCLQGPQAPSSCEVAWCCCYQKSLWRSLWIPSPPNPERQCGTLKGKCREVDGKEERRGEDDVEDPRNPSIIHFPPPPLFFSCSPLFFSFLWLKLVLAAWKKRAPWCVGKGERDLSEASPVGRTFFFLWLSLVSLHTLSIRGHELIPLVILSLICQFTKHIINPFIPPLLIFVYFY